MTAEFDVITRRMVEHRAESCCEICGLIPQAPQYHHRRPRGQGGTHRADSTSPANCLYLCQSCHHAVETAIRLIAHGCGWLVSQYHDPAAARVLRRFRWVLLDEDGGIIDWKDDDG